MHSHTDRYAHKAAPLCAAEAVQARCYRVNVADEGEVSAAMTRVGADFGRLDGLVVVWAKELARYGIRVGSIAPGFTRTEILASMRPEVLEKLTAPVPLRRLGQPDEIAHAVLFIFESDFFTGRCLELDGGLRL
jgi:3-oxoacyl-[acyl-carrier protein] reductase